MNKSIGLACNIKTGKLDANQAVKGGSYPFFTCAERPDEIDHFAFDGDVVLIAGNNARGNFHVSRFTGKFNAYQRTYVLTTNEGFDIDYIYYALKIELKRLREKSQGSQTKFLTMPILTGIQLQNLNFHEQASISSVLRAIDDKIDCNNRINKRLESLAKLLYDYWFVQFDFPNADGKPYKSSGGTMIFNDVLKREIPQGWDVTPLASWIANDKTGDWGKEAPEGNHILRVSCIRGTDLNALNGIGVISAPIRYILQKNKSKLLTPFDFVIEISGGSPTQSTGRISNIIPETLSRFSDPIICSNFCKAISLFDNSYYFNFAYLWKSAYHNGVLFGWEGKTSGIKNLLFDAFTQKFYVPTPPKGIASKFFEFISPIESKRQLLCQENDYLEATRDWLLPMLMNGQVTAS